MSLETEGYTMDSNIFRPGRDLRVEPLSEFELNIFQMDHPEWNLPSTEAMLNAQYELILRPEFNLKIPEYSKPYEIEQAIEISVKPLSFDDLFNHQEKPISAELQKILAQAANDEESIHEERSNQTSALGEVAEALSIIFNPLRWFD